MTPKISTVHQDDTHRLVPCRHDDDSVLKRLSESAERLEDLFELDSATNDRLLGEANLLAGISVHELLFGVPHARIVNAAFCHAHPAGGRFNGPDRGAWYAAFEAETGRAEVAFHKTLELQEIDWREPETFAFDDYRADFRSDFHDLRGDARFADCLDPIRYDVSRRLASGLLAGGSGGIVYPSVRRTRGTCIVCFRPALVTNVRKTVTVTMRFKNARLLPEA
ncbi:MAG: RES family NAD+ phosphorylase [Acidobacteria bacterium]|nr:RES family NAD+ phosphorylase [Acidobacteriota bacterium]MBI3264584.1 RES family NAD+ phosphorylase [Acidobacteriota bacterium]